MPRYCAVKVCRNRRGTASGQDKKRISFYPFPIRDKPRLQRWVCNIKREEWAPSRHQYLCSDHFTADCFDIRWGIRYLKSTATPTIFPSTEDEVEKKMSAIKRSPQASSTTLETDIEPTGFNAPLGKRPLIVSRTCEQSTTTNTAAENTEIFEPRLVADNRISRCSNLSELQTASCEKSGSCGMTTVSCLPLSQCIEPHSEEHTDATVKVSCCEADEDANAHQAAPGQAFTYVPMEMVVDASAHCFLEERGSDAGEHMHAHEHSYCRRDTDKDQLWRRILSLHAKILELDRREESTVAKVRALETKISFLRRDSTVFKERHKVLEDYISSMLF